MRALHKIILIFVVGSLLGCKAANQTSNLKVTLGPTPATALPVDMESCKSTGTADLTKPTFQFNTFNFQWTGGNDMKIAYIQIDFKSGLLQGGEYQCIIAGDELEQVLFPKQDGITGNDSTSYKSSCGIRCGALNIVSTANSAYLSGTAKIIGTEVDSEGNATPVVTEVSVAVQYTKP